MFYRLHWQRCRGNTLGWVAYFSGGLSNQGLFGHTICKALSVFSSAEGLVLTYTPKLKSKEAKLQGGGNLTSLNRESSGGVGVPWETGHHLALHPNHPGMTLSSCGRPFPQQVTL